MMLEKQRFLGNRVCNYSTICIVVQSSVAGSGKAVQMDHQCIRTSHSITGTDYASADMGEKWGYGRGMSPTHLDKHVFLQ